VTTRFAMRHDTHAPRNLSGALRRRMLEAVALGTQMLDNVLFEGLGGSRSSSPDELSTKPEGEKAVCLGLDNHTSRIPNVSYLLVLCHMSCCCVTQYMSLARDTARVYSMLQTYEMTDRWSPIWANK